MGVLDTLMKFIVKKFWPWFLDFVWPYIKEHFRALINFVIDNIIEMIKKWVEDKTSKREQEAYHKAYQADEKADKASSDMNEAEKHRAVAEVWREVAEQFRKDNEELKKRIDEIENEAKEGSTKIIDDLKLNVDFSKDKPTLKIGDEIRELPSLPE